MILCCSWCSFSLYRLIHVVDFWTNKIWKTHRHSHAQQYVIYLLLRVFQRVCRIFFLCFVTSSYLSYIYYAFILLCVVVCSQFFRFAVIFCSYVVISLILLFFFPFFTYMIFPSLTTLFICLLIFSFFNHRKTQTTHTVFCVWLKT